MAPEQHAETTAPPDEWQPLFRDCRFGLWASILGLLLGYALSTLLKVLGLMPDHITRFVLALAPATILVPFGSVFGGVLWLRHRWWVLFLPVTIISLAVSLGLSFTWVGR